MYAMRIEPGAYITLGGLHIDPEARVLREDGSNVAGLYAGRALYRFGPRPSTVGDDGNGNTQALAYGLQVRPRPSWPKIG